MIRESGTDDVCDDDQLEMTCPGAVPQIRYEYDDTAGSMPCVHAKVA